VMCPDKKLKWFKDHGQTAAQIQDIKKMVIEHWDETYKGENLEELPPAPAHQPEENQDPDTIATYQVDPVIRLSIIKEAGGIMKYWHQAIEQRPQLA
ncbi:hypothetical protein L208DRAFT_1066469, partial [Tricholoma matsutake]